MALKDWEHRRIWKAFAVICAIIGFIGCTKPQRPDPQYGAFGRYKRVEMWSGGQKVGEWKADGEVHMPLTGVWQFTDADSSQTVRITGDVVVTTTNVGD